MSDYLPQEAWSNIFTRLQAKTLLQIRSVCKRFNSIINSSSFISDYITAAKNPQIPLIRYLPVSGKGKTKERYLLLPSTDSEINNKRELIFPFKSRSKPHFRIISSCNGVLCLCDCQPVVGMMYRAYGVILWNPSIKKYLILPKPHLTLKIHDTFVLGFGYDSQTDDYKVLRISYVTERYSREHIVIELYSVKLGLWRRLNRSPVRYETGDLSPVFFNGSVHWIGRGRSGPRLIMRFDMSNEAFLGEMNLPNNLDKFESEFNLGVLGKKFAVVHSNGWMEDMVQVWVMEEYGVADSWKKTYTVDINGGFIKFVGLTNNGDVIGVVDDDNLVLYAHNGRRLRWVGVCGNGDSFHVATYMESLALLGGESAVLQPKAKAISCVGDGWLMS